ncbi:MAG TPA: nuclear transport factor 2 family protein [Pyrinomonadaceae bacterium]|nr:nuclear transport factor 2 family protein [Pyrinomonadaceae bacterium]
MNIMIAAVFVSLICAFAVFPQDEGQAIEQTVKTLERDLSAAIAKGDAAIVDRILAHDYIEVTAQGLLQKKADILALVRAIGAAPKSIKVGPEIAIEETKLSVYGDVAIWFGLKVTKYPHMEYQVAPGSGQLPPPDITERQRFMKVYVRRRGRWQLMASQLTSAPQPIPSTPQPHEFL